MLSQAIFNLGNPFSWQNVTRQYVTRQNQTRKNVAEPITVLLNIFIIQIVLPYISIQKQYYLTLANMQLPRQLTLTCIYLPIHNFKSLFMYGDCSSKYFLTYVILKCIIHVKGCKCKCMSMYVGHVCQFDIKGGEFS